MNKGIKKPGEVDVAEVASRLGRDLMVPDELFPVGSSDRTSYLAGAAMMLYVVGERMKEERGSYGIGGLLMITELVGQLNSIKT